MFSRAELEHARATVRAAMPPTPQRQWPALSARTGRPLWVKHEDLAPTGSFKVRGGLTYLDALRDRCGPTLRLAAATRGNHGQSIAYAAARHGVPVRIFVPQGNSPLKNAAMRRLGAELIEAGVDFQDALEAAQRTAEADGLHFVPSFHRDLVLGVATYALELFEAVGTLSTLYVAIGLGSGICGCAVVRDLLGADVEIVGVQAEAAPAYARSFAAGVPVAAAVSETLADGIATRVPDPAAFAIIRRSVSRILTVSEAEIRSAMAALWTDTGSLAEGAGAAALAGALRDRTRRLSGTAAVILSGGNVDRRSVPELG